jgi:hypothetical protein
MSITSAGGNIARASQRSAKLSASTSGLMSRPSTKNSRSFGYGETPYDSELHTEPWVQSTSQVVEAPNLIENVLGQLSTRDQHVLREFFLAERAKDEICREMCLSEPQFRVILFQAKVASGKSIGIA